MTRRPEQRRVCTHDLQREHRKSPCLQSCEQTVQGQRVTAGPGLLSTSPDCWRSRRPMSGSLRPPVAEKMRSIDLRLFGVGVRAVRSDGSSCLVVGPTTERWRASGPVLGVNEGGASCHMCLTIEVGPLYPTHILSRSLTSTTTRLIRCIKVPHHRAGEHDECRR